MASEYSLSVVLERMYEYHLVLEAAVMEWVLLAEQQGHEIVGQNARCALERISHHGVSESSSLGRNKFGLCSVTNSV